MKEHLHIKNFAGIRELKLDLKSINILIGPQATGKSITAKLLYHFKGLLWDIFTAAENRQTKRELDAAFLREFEEYFPPSSWGKDSFTVRYEISDVFVQISRAMDKKPKLKLSYSAFFQKGLNLIRRELKNIKEKYPDDKRDRWEAIYQTRNKLLSSACDQLGERASFDQIFIPAGRSFFANLQNSIFSLLSTNNAIDPLLTEFGRFYESMKDVPQLIQRRGDYDKELKEKIDVLTESILRSRYTQEKGKDILQHKDGRKTSIANASSGQQEVLPLAIILSLFPLIRFGRKGSTIYIEEPEAHLFPTSQHAIVQLLAIVFNRSKIPLQFIITTHSPYILTALNNLMQAGHLRTNLPKEKHSRVYKIVPEEQILLPDEVRAYALEDGRGKLICCHDTGLISADIIDEVSSALSVQFDDLLEVE